MTDDADSAPRKGRKPGSRSLTRRGSEITGDEREALSLWMKERISEIENQHQQRVEILRTVGEHPSPIFAAMVKQHAYAGLPESLIAKLMCCSVSTLKSYYADELDLGRAELIHSVGMNMARIATSVTDPNNAKVGMEILGRRGGEEWRPPAQKIDMKTQDAGPPVLDSSALSYEDRQLLREIMQRAIDPKSSPTDSDPTEEDPIDAPS
jgi:hypothetical protein